MQFRHCGVQFKTHAKPQPASSCDTAGPLAHTTLRPLRPLRPLQNNYGARRMHPTVKAALTELFREPNRRVAALLGRGDLGWAGLGPQDA